MIPKLDLWMYIGAGVLLVGAVGGAYWYVYHQGEKAAIVQQKEALEKLREKTDAVQDRALTTANPRDELRKYSRPD